MAKVFRFDPDDSLRVGEGGALDADGLPIGTRWNLSAEQVAKHRPMFNADMSAADRAAADAIAARLVAAAAAK